MRRSTVAMRTPTYFVLASMLGGPLHASAIIERAAAMSEGRVRLPTGALYTALDTVDGRSLRAQGQ
jgi:PadR family transcriptional regulator, regulatory protein PadR